MDRVHVGDRLAAGVRPEPIGCLPQPVEPRPQAVVFGDESSRQLGVDRRDRSARQAASPGAQCVENHRDIDGLLDQGTRGGRKEAEAGDDHRSQRHPDPDQHALTGDPPRSAGDGHRLGEPVEAVDREHDIGRLGGGGHARRSHRDSDVGPRQRRRIVDAIADHDGRTERLLRDHGVHLVGRAALGEHRVDAQHDSDTLGHVGPITRHHHDPADAATPQVTDRAGGVGPHRVVEQERAGGRIIDGDEHRECTVEISAATNRRRPPRIGHRRDPCRLPDRDRLIADHPAHTTPGYLLDVAGDRQDQITSMGGPNDRRGDDMGRDLVERSGQTEQLVGSSSRNRDDVGDHRSTDRQRARLVQQQHPPRGQPLQREAALDEQHHARPCESGPEVIAIGAARIKGQGVATTRTATARTASPDNAQASPATARVTARNATGVAIGESDERRTRRLRLRLGHQPHDPGVRAVGRASRGAQHERVAGVHGATADTITGPAFDGKGLARQRRLVEHSDISLDTTVDGHDLTRPHQQQVTWRHVFDGR